MDDHLQENNKRIKINRKSKKFNKKELNIRLNAAIQHIHKKKIKSISEKTGLTRDQIQYWKSKLTKGKHMNSWGGHRSSRFKLEHRKILGDVIQKILDTNDTLTIKEICMRLKEEIPINLTESYVRNIIIDMKKGWETPEDKVKDDSYEMGLTEFFSHLEWIQQEDVDKLVFMDKLNINNEELKEENNIAITCMVRHDGSIFVSYLSTNDKNDLLEIILQSIEAGVMKKGDILLIDKSGVRSGKNTFPLIIHALSLVGATLRFLPEYVTELNPIGKVFGLVKGYFKRNNVSSEDDLYHYIYAAFSSVQQDTIQTFFKKAINPLINE